MEAREEDREGERKGDKDLQWRGQEGRYKRQREGEMAR